MNIIKTIVGLVLALYMVNVLVVAKVGREARLRKGSVMTGYVLFIPIALVHPQYRGELNMYNSMRIRAP